MLTGPDLPAWPLGAQGGPVGRKGGDLGEWLASRPSRRLWPS